MYLLVAERRFEEYWEWSNNFLQSIDDGLQIINACFVALFHSETVVEFMSDVL